MTIKGMAVVERATKSALDRVNKAARPDMSRDADLQFYEQLTPEAFNVIADTYGPDALVSYIQTMESKRIKNHGNRS